MCLILQTNSIKYYNYNVVDPQVAYYDSKNLGFGQAGAKLLKIGTNINAFAYLVSGMQCER